MEHHDPQWIACAVGNILTVWDFRGVRNERACGDVGALQRLVVSIRQAR